MSEDHLSLAQQYYREQKFKDAVLELLYALQESPNDHKIRYALACVYTQINEEKKAITEFQKVIVMAPGTTETIQAKSWLDKHDSYALAGEKKNDIPKETIANNANASTVTAKEKAFMNCNKCGTLVAVEDSFCGRCGSNLAASDFQGKGESPRDNTTPQEPKPKTRTVSIFGIFVLFSLTVVILTVTVSVLPHVSGFTEFMPVIEAVSLLLGFIILIFFSVIYLPQAIAKKYSIKLAGTNGCIFEDPNIKVIFRLDVESAKALKQIPFVLENKTTQPIKIDWDSCLFVDPNENSCRSIHTGVKIIDRNAPQPESVVASRSKLNDILVPSDNLYYQQGFRVGDTYLPGGWVTKPILRPWAGKEHFSFRILLTLRIGDEKKSYEFNFQAVKV